MEQLKAQTKGNDKSLEANARYILEQSYKADMVTAREMALDMRMKLKGRKFPDVVDSR